MAVLAVAASVQGLAGTLNRSAADLTLPEQSRTGKNGSATVRN